LDVSFTKEIFSTAEWLNVETWFFRSVFDIILAGIYAARLLESKKQKGIRRQRWQSYWCFIAGTLPE